MARSALLSMVPAAKSTAPPAPPTRADLVDEFGELDRQIAAFAPTKKRHEQLQGIIRSWFADHPSESPATVSGHVYTVQVSPRGEERYFSLKAKLQIFKRLGKEKALELFSITLKAVEESLGRGDMEMLVSKANSGSRKLVPVLHSPVSKTAA